MNIIYFTTALDNLDYESYVKIWKVKPNPSNQNFHNKMIRSLAINHHVDVISFRPFSKSLTTVKSLEKEEKVVTNIHWHYAPIKRFRIARIIEELKYSLSVLKSVDKESIIFTDTINPIVLYAAIKVGRKLKLPVIGVVTDSPSNITGTKRSYTTFLLNKAKHLSGYVALTKELEEMFNINSVPSTIFEGIVDDFGVEKTLNDNPYGEYLFFGGSLLEKYGIYNLIEAFNKIENKDLKLVICGHHGDEKRIKKCLEQNENIIYLNTLPVRKIIELENQAFACINPRPYSEDLDRYSIPSKTIEYLNSGHPTISVKNTKLQKYFYNDIIWAKSGSVEDLFAAINKLLELNKNQRDLLGYKAKIKVNLNYSLQAINTKLNELIDIIK